MTTVVNVKNEKCDIYCGRPTIYGNPFIIGRDGTREDVIMKFIDYFFNRLKRDSKFKESVLLLKGKKLGCYCYPLICHCMVIAKYLDNYE